MRPGALQRFRLMKSAAAIPPTAHDPTSAAVANKVHIIHSTMQDQLRLTGAVHEVTVQGVFNQTRLGALVNFSE